MIAPQLPLFGEASVRAERSARRRWLAQERDRQRAATQDRYQGRALARVLEALGSGVLRIVARPEDAELLEVFREAFAADGAELLEGGLT